MHSGPLVGGMGGSDMLILAVSLLWSAYLLCFLLGLGYAVFAAIFGAFSGHDFGGGGHDVSVPHDLGGGHDVVAGYDATSADVGGHAVGDISHEPAISPFSPPIVAMTLITFGGTGIIFTELFGWGTLSVLPSGASGIGMGVIIFFLFYTIIRKAQGSSSPSIGETIGLEAEATTPIPPDGVGEIAYVARGSRFTARARCSTGQTLPSHSAVRIERWVGNTAYVKPSS
jgi:hypothetical protein